MSDVILKVENVSKLYRLGTVGTGTFGGDVQRFLKTKILGQEDPFLKIGQTNDRTSKKNAEFVWALQDINFEVKRGEVLGLIGKNGAGKSTLLKLLSRITSPTTGKILLGGRMASLLEVGTGFHPELTGRENIFLNGAILGMTKKEIQRKFDEIVDFSGCDLYIDTPTKRYSSGMTVRLGFAVAAFLDPEILVVDEVLAVGDADFQSKAIGKMQDVSRGEGKTVLFVSHNMESISKLCPQSILLENGSFKIKDDTEKVIREYFQISYNSLQDNQINQIIVNEYLTISNVRFNNSANTNLEQGQDWCFGFNVNKTVVKPIKLTVNIEVKTIDGVYIGCFGNEMQFGEINITKEQTAVKFELGTMVLKTGDYLINIYVRDNFNPSTYIQDFGKFTVVQSMIFNQNWNFYVNKPQHGYNPIIFKDIHIN